VLARRNQKEKEKEEKAMKLSGVIRWVVAKLVRVFTKRTDCGEEFFIDIFKGQDDKWYIRIIDDTGDIWFRSTDAFDRQWEAEYRATKFLLHPPTEVRVMDDYLDKRKEVKDG